MTDIATTSRELSAKDGDGGPLGTLADIASSVHSVLVCLGDGGALGALSDSVEPSLLEELPLVSVEAVSVVSSVPVVDEEPGLLSDVPLVLAALLSVDERQRPSIWHTLTKINQICVMVFPCVSVDNDIIVDANHSGALF